MVAKAKELCQDLVANVREHYEEFRSRPRGSYRDNNRFGDRGDSYGGSRGYGRHGSDGPRDSAPGTDSPGGAGVPDYAAQAAQYAQYYGGQDPYAAYGGYAKWVLR